MIGFERYLAFQVDNQTTRSFALDKRSGAVIGHGYTLPSAFGTTVRPRTARLKKLPFYRKTCRRHPWQPSAALRIVYNKNSQQRISIGRRHLPTYRLHPRYTSWRPLYFRMSLGGLSNSFPVTSQTSRQAETILIVVLHTHCKNFLRSKVENPELLSAFFCRYGDTPAKAKIRGTRKGAHTMQTRTAPI